MKKFILGVIAGLSLLAGVAFALDLAQPIIIGGQMTGTTILQPYYATPKTVTADYTLLVGDSTILNAKTGSTMTMTLLTASSYPGKRFRVMNGQAQTVVSAGSNVVPCATGSASTAILAGTSGKWAELESDGTNWVITACN